MIQSGACYNFNIRRLRKRQALTGGFRERTAVRLRDGGIVQRSILWCGKTVETVKGSVRSAGKGGADVINDSIVMLRKATDAHLISKQQLLGGN